MKKLIDILDFLFFIYKEFIHPVILLIILLSPLIFYISMLPIDEL